MSEIKVTALRGLGVSSSGPAIVLNSTGTFNFDSGTLFVDSTNNRIGVNKVSPSYDLDITGSFAVSGVTRIASTSETIENRSAGQSGNQTYDFNVASIFYHPSVNGDINAFFTNVPTEQNRAYGFSIIFQQGGTARRINTGLNINGSAINTRWLGGTTPTITANRVEVFNFSIFNAGGTFVALGQLSSHN